MKPLRAALYVRVSTADQTTANQFPALRELAARHQVEIVVEYQDVASGKRGSSRPGLNALRDDAQRRKFDVLLIWSIDRLGRNLLEILNLLEELRTSRVRVISERESWLDTGNATSQLLTAILAWVAEYERARQIERTLAGIAQRRAAGLPLGRPVTAPTPARVLYVYELNLANPELKDRATSATAKQLGISREHVRRLLIKAREATQAMPEITDAETFGRRVLEVSRAAPERARFGASKVYLSHARRLLGLPKRQFDELAIEANRLGYLRLARADLPELMDKAQVAESMVQHGRDDLASFHFVRV